MPFQNVIDYSQISIKWPSSRIGPELLQYLESIPGGNAASSSTHNCSYIILSFKYNLFVLIIVDEEIERIIARGREVRCWWVYASDSEPCSAMRGIMWELQRKVRQFHHSAETFWLHNGSIVNRNLVQFSKWELPVPLP